MIDHTEPPVELEFRDGKHHVPYYLARYMSGWETYLMTYAEAVAAVNKEMEREVVAKGMTDLLDTHFRNFS